MGTPNFPVNLAPKITIFVVGYTIPNATPWVKVEILFLLSFTHVSTEHWSSSLFYVGHKMDFNK